MPLPPLDPFDKLPSAVLGVSAALRQGRHGSGKGSLMRPDASPDAFRGRGRGEGRGPRSRRSLPPADPSTKLRASKNVCRTGVCLGSGDESSFWGFVVGLSERADRSTALTPDEEGWRLPRRYPGTSVDNCPPGLVNS